MDDRVVGAREQVAGNAAVPGRYALDHCRGTELISVRPPLNFAHMAILAGRAVGRRRRRAVFAECFFELEAVEQRDVVAGATECRASDRREVLDIAMNLAPGFVRVGGHLIIFGVR